MKIVAGIALIVLGAVAALYIGVWLMLAGGVVDVVQSLKADNLPEWELALGVVKILLASPVGWFCFVLPAAIGFHWVAD